MAEGRFEDTDQIEAERYQVELVPLAAETGSSSLSTLQVAVNKGARQSWRIVGVAQDPTSQGVLLVWDTSGFISG
ncbi:MAG: hypothetical protein M3M97_04600 [Actinomycetota bacterium]|nr:hypothetical protein [Actinomycetota bacterium]